MKIRHVVRGRCNPDNADGIIRHTYHLAHAQLRLGHDVGVYGMESSSPEAEIIDRFGLPVYAYPRTRLPFSVHPDLVARLDGPDSDVDVVHIQAPHDPHMFRLSRLLKQRDIAYFVSPHAMWEPGALERHRIRKMAYKRLFDDRINADAAGIHATAANELDAISRYAPNAPVFVVRNAIDPSEFDEVGLATGRVRSQVSLTPETRIFIFLGRLDPYQKGLDVLFEAWSLAMSTGAQACLVLIGPSWRGSGPRLEKMTQDLNISNSVVFTGPLFGREKVETLLDGDCYIQLSRYETSPYSIQEAFASKLPGILTAETNFAAVTERYGAGWLVPHDPKAVAARIVEVVRMSKEQLEGAGEKARLLVEERHSIDRAASKIVAAYAAARSDGDFENDD